MIVAGWGAATDTGRVRAANEDSFFARAPVFVVADGMGGHAAGEVASRLAAETFAALAERDTLGVNDAVSAVGSANTAILDQALAAPEMEGMGTTLAGLAVVTAGGSEHWQVFNVGDCRVYRYSGGHLDQLTVDHSEAEELVASGRLSKEDARDYARRHVVTRSLGTDPAPHSDSWVFPPSPPERFLICSDGLTNELEDREIEATLASEADPQRAADRLVAQAVEAGGHDNVTAIVVDASPPFQSTVDEDTNPREHHGV
ncbi:MAG TPA: protein phosphatase 2C domain-containing protein [Acidimicrobiales bacterium]|nr:protein phosphatase 2C domain-containing protein [Acidimicrobiales bacterium]